MLKKLNKPDKQVRSYRPISLLLTKCKLLEKLLIKRLKTHIKISDFKFGFRNRHFTTYRVHRITSVIERVFEEKEYYPAVFIYVLQTFNIYKMIKMLPKNHYQLLEPYIFLKENAEYPMKLSFPSTI